MDSVSGYRTHRSRWRNVGVNELKSDGRKESRVESDENALTESTSSVCYSDQGYVFSTYLFFFRDTI